MTALLWTGPCTVRTTLRPINPYVNTFDRPPHGMERSNDETSGPSVTSPNGRVCRKSLVSPRCCGGSEQVRPERRQAVLAAVEERQATGRTPPPAVLSERRTRSVGVLLNDMRNPLVRRTP